MKVITTILTVLALTTLAVNAQEKGKGKAKASPEEIDYVICHELAHFRRRDHSPAFWREVETLYPEWETVRRRLRQNGPLYFLF